MTLLKRKTRQPKVVKVNGGGGAKQFLSKVSGAFMLPISVMAIAGLFLGVGAAIEAHTTGSFAIVGTFIKNMGDPIFGAMPMLFAAAIVVAFTDEAGVGVFAAIIGMLIFSALQSVFITSQDHIQAADAATEGFKINNKLLSGLSNAKDLDGIKSIVSGLEIPKTISSGGIDFHLTGSLSTYAKGLSLNAGGALPSATEISTGLNSLYHGGSTTLTGFDFNNFGTKDIHDGFKILFSEVGRDAGSMEKLVGSTLGIQAINTSIFGGIAVGAIVSYLYNKFHTIELPQIISFFGGKRFVALVVIIAMIPLAFIFLVLWPWIGKGLSVFGNSLGDIPYGFDSFIFGFIERSLIPFGLHHVFYAPLWWTNAGGDAGTALQNFEHISSAGNIIGTGSHFDVHLGSATGELLRNKISANPTKWMGDSYTWLAAQGLGVDHFVVTNHDTSAVVNTFGDTKVFPFFANNLHLKLGRFMQGKFPFMIFALPAAAFAMVMAAPKENRKMALGTVFPAALTSFVTGVTEPIEFTFLFLAPLLFWGFHAVMAGASFLAMNMLNAHIGMTFSGGFLDLMIYGAIPTSLGTNFYWAFVVGPLMAPIYFFVFYWAIKRFNLETPGRGNNTKLFSKADFKTKKSKIKTGNLKSQSAAIVLAFGGWDNILSYKNCATRLRYDVNDASLVSTSELKAAGAAGVVKVGDKHFQAIMGPQAEQINGNIKGNIGADLGVVEQPVQTVTKNIVKEPIIVEEKIIQKEIIETIEKPIVEEEKPVVIKQTVVKSKPKPKVVKSKPTVVKSKPTIVRTKPVVSRAPAKPIITFKAVTPGTVMPLMTMDNGAFAVMGKGVAISPTSKTTKSQKFYSPISGKVTLVFPTKHAYGLKDPNGVEVLIHIGVDTVALDGQGFTAHVKQGQTVKVGDLIAEADFSIISSQVPSVDTAVVVTSGHEISNVFKGRATKVTTIFKAKIIS